jgi:Rieske Fe-S protein
MSHHHPTTAPDGRPEVDQPAWRQDFPIETEQDNYVARRDFTKFLVLISGAFATGQLWIGVQNWLRKRRGLPPKVRVASLNDLAVGQSVTFRYPGPHDDCIMIRPDDSTVLAYNQKCTHLACPVIPDGKGNCFHCPAHNGLFEQKTGKVVSGPPRRPLPRITLELRGDDIYATGVEVRMV